MDHITKRGAERLLKGAELLEGVPRRMFDMRYWYAARSNHVGPIKNPQMHDSPNIECRTTACAGGWMASNPWFRQRGLKLKIKQRALEYENADVVYNDLNGSEALAEFFEIDRVAAYTLFVDLASYHGNSTPKQVAKRIRKFVKTGYL